MTPRETELELKIDAKTLEIRYGPHTRGPEPEYRTLDAIRTSLMDPACGGPSPVYSIAMDVRREGDEPNLKARHLLFGVVAYTAGSWAGSRYGAKDMFMRLPLIADGHLRSCSRYGRAKRLSTHRSLRPMIPADEL